MVGVVTVAVTIVEMCSQELQNEDAVEEAWSLLRTEETFWQKGDGDARTVLSKIADQRIVSFVMSFTADEGCQKRKRASWRTVQARSTVYVPACVALLPSLAHTDESSSVAH